MPRDTGEPFWQPRGAGGRQGRDCSAHSAAPRLTLLENNCALLIIFARKIAS